MDFSKIIATASIFLITGIGCGSFFKIENFYHLFFGIILIFVFIWARNLFFVFLILGGFLGFYLGNLLIEKELSKLDNIFEGEIYEKVKVVKYTEEKNGKQQVVVKPLKDNNESRIQNRALLFVPAKPSYNYGDVLKIKCKLKRPENNYEKFNYQRFLAKKDIYQICQRPKIEKIGDIKTLPHLFTKKEKVFLHLIKFRKTIEHQVNILLPQPESGYLAGLFLGGDNRLPKYVAENFRLTSTTHVVAVSGSNIAIISELLILLGIFLGLYRRQAFWLVILGIFIFIVLIGSPTSAVRAGVMSSLILWANRMGRLTESTRAIIFASTIIVAISPLTLIYDAGFQLSVLATLGIVWFYQPLKERFNIEKDFLELKSILLVTICAQIGVLGLIIFSFENLSTVSLPTNLLILPIIPIIMLLGFFMILTSFFSPILKKILLYPTYFLLHSEIAVVEFFSKIPKVNLKITNFDWKLLVFYYLLIFLIAMKIRKRKIKSSK